MPISTSAMVTSPKKQTPQKGGWMVPIYWTDLGPQPLRLGPFDPRHDAEQLGEDARGRPPDEVAGHAIEVDRKVTVERRGRSSRLASPPLFEECAIGEEF